ncbi:MAG: hypothetical protein ABH834_00880 [Candidatus Altiarchaeota archaeon]
MKRRSNNILYFSDELIQKVLERRPLRLWDFTDMFFPRETNRKQFDCAFKFLNELEKRGSMSNSEVRGLFDSTKEQILLMSHVLPKLQKFRLVESDSGGNSKKYNLRFSRNASFILRELGMDVLKFYARHYNDVKQLEGDTL